jgi:hypothetical protein
MYFFVDYDIAVCIKKRKRRIADNLPLVSLTLIHYQNREVELCVWEELPVVVGKYFFHTKKQAKNFANQALENYYKELYPYG